ncbi:MAG: histidine phosphatase family protein [Bacillota bacterium]|nr:histidine phosphatase family protein [Bacillota bacterium]
MTKIVLVRHGEPDYSMVTARKFKGHGRDLAQLTSRGIEQAKAAAGDERLDGASLIVASPYTRALQTAAIISKERSLDISIEVDIHEWLPDLSYNYMSEEEVKTASQECIVCKGEYAEDDLRNWERLSVVAERAFNSLKKYLNHDKIIVVTHGVVMRQFKFLQEIPYCGIIEVDFCEDFKWGGWIET